MSGHILARVQPVAAVLLLAVIVAFAFVIRADAAGPKACNSRHHVGVFNDCDLAQLKSWNVTPVAPQYVPPNFVATLRLDSANRKYDITYNGPNGAYFVFEGGAHVTLGQPEEKSKKGNILSGIKSSINNLFGHHSASGGTAPESEFDPNQLDIAAPSQVIGPAHFKADSANCATGVAEKGLNSTKYALKGCNSSADILKDQLVRVYRSVDQVQAH